MWIPVTLLNLISSSSSCLFCHVQPWRGVSSPLPHPNCVRKWSSSTDQSASFIFPLVNTVTPKTQNRLPQHTPSPSALYHLKTIEWLSWTHLNWFFVTVLCLCDYLISLGLIKVSLWSFFSLFMVICFLLISLCLSLQWIEVSFWSFCVSLHFASLLCSFYVPIW